MALWGATHGVGPFVTLDRNLSLLLLQAFIGTLTVTTLVLSAVVTERKRAERRLHVQDAVGRALIESQTLKEATPRIFHALCEVGGWDVVALWQVDRTANELFCVEVWHVRSLRVPEFEAITRERRFAPGVGLPGRAWAMGKPAWLPNLTVDSNSPRAPVALKEGLRAGFCFPLKVGNEVIGVIECFSRQQHEPDENFLQMLAVIGNQLGQFIDREKAEEALRAKEAQLRLITDITPVMLAQCSPEGRYTFVNHAYAQRFGMTPEEIAGRRFAEVMGEKAVEAIQPYIDIVLQGRPVEYEIEIPYSRLDPRFMRVAYTPDRDERGRVRGWVASISDITERKRVEEANRRIETLHSAILNSALDCIISIDRAGRIIEFNPAAEKTFGYSRAEAMGNSMADLIIPARFREQHHRGMAHYLAAGEGPVLGRRIEMSALCANGTEIPVELSINTINVGADIVFTATLRDITERKRTEAALEEARAQLKAHADDLELIVAERTQELRETIAEVESFSYSISHDMRGPLRAMQGYASVLEQELKGKIGDEEWRYLGRIVAAAARLNRLVQDILSYSQISRTKLQLAPVDLHALMIEVIQQNPNLQSPLADVRIERPLPIVFGQEAALTQICSKPAQQCGEVRLSGTTPAFRISSELKQRHGAHLYCRSRHRHRSEEPRTHFPDVRTGEQPEGLRRHRHRTRDCEESCRAHGRDESASHLSLAKGPSSGSICGALPAIELRRIAPMPKTILLVGRQRRRRVLSDARLQSRRHGRAGVACRRWTTSHRLSERKEFFC
jgi:PAS domain S-box-containing protein